MPLLRISCVPDHTEQILEILLGEGEASEISVIRDASWMTGGDLVLADVPRSTVDELLTRVVSLDPDRRFHVTVQASERLFPELPGDAQDDDAVVWAEVIHDVNDEGRLSGINVLLVVIAAMIAAIGILEDQLLLIVGAMALSPDYFPTAVTCIAIVRGRWREAARGLRTLLVMFTAGALGALVLSLALDATGIAPPGEFDAGALTLFISRPDGLTVAVALLAGVAGALALTLPDARGLVGVFVSITTIPAAANIGVALAAGNRSEMGGAAIQLVVNVGCLILSGVLTLEIRRRAHAVDRHFQ